jgi:hypothetical protein
MTINEAKGMSNENWARFTCRLERTFIRHIFVCGGEIGKRLIGMGNGMKPMPKRDKPFARLTVAVSENIDLRGWHG